MDYRIQEVLIRIENNLPHPHTVSELAESINISASYFQHLFKRDVGFELYPIFKKIASEEGPEFSGNYTSSRKGDPGEDRGGQRNAFLEGLQKFIRQNSK